MATARVDKANGGTSMRRSRPSSRRRVSLFWRLFVAYAGVMALAVSVLVFAPVTVSVPTALTEVAVLLAGFVIALAIYFAGSAGARAVGAPDAADAAH